MLRQKVIIIFEKVKEIEAHEPINLRSKYLGLYAY